MSAPVVAPPPRLARAIFDYVRIVPRAYDAVIDWAKRKSWPVTEAMDAVAWLGAQKLVETQIATGRLSVVPGAVAPEGEDKPGPSDGGLTKPVAKDEKAAPAIDRPEAEVDEDDEGEVDSDEENDGDEPEGASDDEDAIDEDSTSPSPPVAEQSPPPPRARRPAPRELLPAELTSREGEPPPKWLPELILFLGKVRSRWELGQWALPRAIPTHRLMEQIDALESAGRLKVSGTRSNRYYQLDGAPLVRNPPRKFDEAPAAPPAPVVANEPPASPPSSPKPALPAPPVSAPDAAPPAAPSPSPAPPPAPPAPAPAPEVVMPASKPAKSPKSPKSKPAARPSRKSTPATPPPPAAAEASAAIVVASPAPLAPRATAADVVRAFVALSPEGRERALELLAAANKIATRAESLRTELAAAEGELEAALRGEGPAPALAAPVTPAKVRKAIARTKGKAPTSERRPKGEAPSKGIGRGGPGVSKNGGPSIAERIKAALQPGEEVRAADMASRLGIEVNTAATTLGGLARDGELERPTKGLYRLPVAKPARKAGAR